MIIDVKGGCKSQRVLAENVAHFCAEQLLSDKLSDKIELYIEIKSMKREGALGSCIWDDTGIKSREFVITVEKMLDPDLFIETVCHEMVHVKQWAKNELKDNRSKRMWKGEDFSHTPYEEQPWEREAKKFEKDLARKFKKIRKFL
jgi:hypothetical protein